VRAGRAESALTQRFKAGLIGGAARRPLCLVQ
jgi:hypothetical protein